MLFMIISCSTLKKSVDNQNDIKNILENIINQNQVYYKTIIKDLGKPIDYYIEPHLLEFHLCGSELNNDLITITNNEIDSLKIEFSNQKVTIINKLDLNIKTNLTKKQKLNTSFISMPVLFRNNNLAIYYSYSRNGGGFNLLKKINGEWKNICANSVWIE